MLEVLSKCWNLIYIFVHLILSCSKWLQTSQLPIERCDKQNDLSLKANSNWWWEKKELITLTRTLDRMGSAAITAICNTSNTFIPLLSTTQKSISKSYIWRYRHIQYHRPTNTIVHAIITNQFNIWKNKHLVIIHRLTVYFTPTQWYAKKTKPLTEIDNKAFSILICDEIIPSIEPTYYFLQLTLFEFRQQDVEYVHGCEGILIMDTFIIIFPIIRTTWSCMY